MHHVPQAVCVCLEEFAFGGWGVQMRGALRYLMDNGFTSKCQMAVSSILAAPEWSSL